MDVLPKHSTDNITAEFVTVIWYLSWSVRTKYRVTLDLQHRSRNETFPRVVCRGSVNVGGIRPMLYNEICQQCHTIKSPFTVPQTKVLHFQWPVVHSQNTDSRLCICVCIHVKSWTLPGHFFQSSVITGKHRTQSVWQTDQTSA